MSVRRTPSASDSPSRTLAFDEAQHATGVPRDHYSELLAAFNGLEPPRLADIVTRRLHAVSFGAGTRFIVDPLPRALTAEEWSMLVAGLSQRIRALDAFTADIYGERTAVAAGVVPESSLAGSSYLEPDLRRIAPSPRPWIAIAGLDLVRAPDGAFVVLEDNVRTPSGCAYALAAREATHGLLPGEPDVNLGARLADLLAMVLGASRATDAVLLTDGPRNIAYYEHRRLAELAGVPLVTPPELRLRRDELELREDGRPIRCVYRRTDEDRIRDERGQLTAVGALLLPALLAGNLRLVNCFGTGVADDKGLYPYVPELVRFFLDEEPLLASVPTYRLDREEELERVLERLGELVLKPRDGHGGHGVLIGPEATRAQLRRAIAQISADPRVWVAQETVILSTHPTVVDGRLQPRHVDLRPFVFFDGERTEVLPGGLTRYAREEGSMLVNSSRGGGGKDTWVLS
jgi:uncharacterized circularly permuted ATP-grasp superfamily protein